MFRLARTVPDTSLPVKYSENLASASSVSDLQKVLRIKPNNKEGASVGFIHLTKCAIITDQQYCKVSFPGEQATNHSLNELASSLRWLEKLLQLHHYWDSSVRNTNCFCKVFIFRHKFIF
jgi:hypothetical protein